MKVFIMGASGSGTSTLGLALAKKLKIVHADSDNFYWEETDPPFTSPRSAAAMHSLFYDFILNDQFVLSGDVLNWCLPEQEILNAFSHVLFLYVPWQEREKRLRKREYGRFGERVLHNGDMHETHEGFIEWASHYDSGLVPGRNKQSQLEFLKRFNNNGGAILEIDGLQSAEDILSQCFAFIANPGS
jgi:adenylate kinase family enzyme